VPAAFSCTSTNARGSGSPPREAPRVLSRHGHGLREGPVRALVPGDSRHPYPGRLEVDAAPRARLLQAAARGGGRPGPRPLAAKPRALHALLALHAGRPGRRPRAAREAHRAGRGGRTPGTRHDPPRACSVRARVQAAGSRRVLRLDPGRRGGDLRPTHAVREVRHALRPSRAEEIDETCRFNIVHVCDYEARYSDLSPFAAYPGHVVSCSPRLTTGEVSLRDLAKRFGRRSWAAWTARAPSPRGRARRSVAPSRRAARGPGSLHSGSRLHRAGRDALGKGAAHRDDQPLPTRFRRN